MKIYFNSGDFLSIVIKFHVHPTNLVKVNVFEITSQVHKLVFSFSRYKLAILSISIYQSAKIIFCSPNFLFNSFSNSGYSGILIFSMSNISSSNNRLNVTSKGIFSLS